VRAQKTGSLPSRTARSEPVSRKADDGRVVVMNYITLVGKTTWGITNTLRKPSS